METTLLRKTSLRIKVPFYPNWWVWCHVPRKKCSTQWNKQQWHFLNDIVEITYHRCCILSGPHSIMVALLRNIWKMAFIWHQTSPQSCIPSLHSSDLINELQQSDSRWYSWINALTAGYGNGLAFGSGMVWDSVRVSFRAVRLWFNVGLALIFVSGANCRRSTKKNHENNGPRRSFNLLLIPSTVQGQGTIEEQFISSELQLYTILHMNLGISVKMLRCRVQRTVHHNIVSIRQLVGYG